MGLALGWNNYRRSCNQAIRNLGVKHQTIDRKLKCDRQVKIKRPIISERFYVFSYDRYNYKNGRVFAQ